VNAGGDVLWHLARPRSHADRRRERLVALAVACTGAFLLAAFAIISLRGDVGYLVKILPDGGELSESVYDPQGLAPYLAESGLRGGTAFGAALLAVPFVLFGVQALRTGTAARERRLAALSLAGATRPQLRRLAVLEGTRAAVTGAVLSGPLYLLLWLVFGLALPHGARMLPALRPIHLVGWVVLVVLLAGGGALAAGWAARPATVSPLGMVRRAPRPLGPAQAVLPVVGLVVLVLGFAALVLPTGATVKDGSIYVIMLGVLVFALTAGPWSVLLVGRRAARSPDLTTGMAGRRLLADVRSPGRVVAVFFTVGGVLGVISAQLTVLLNPDPQYGTSDQLFALAGFGAAAAGGVLAMTVAAASQVVGATEQVLDSRRATAVLVALAASPSYVSRIVRRQLLLAVVPPAVVGSVVGWVLAGGVFVFAETRSIYSVLAGLAAAMTVTALAAGAGAAVTARLVRPAIQEASSPENLRVA
jgi:hypothetical protein